MEYRYLNLRNSVSMYYLIFQIPFYALNLTLFFQGFDLTMWESRPSSSESMSQSLLSPHSMAIPLNLMVRRTYDRIWE